MAYKYISKKVHNSKHTFNIQFTIYNIVQFFFPSTHPILTPQPQHCELNHKYIYHN
jgi:hypothetical protein